MKILFHYNLPCTIQSTFSQFETPIKKKKKTFPRILQLTLAEICFKTFYTIQIHQDQVPIFIAFLDKDDLHIK